MPAPRTTTDRRIDELAARYLNGDAESEIAFMNAFKAAPEEFKARAHSVRHVRMAIAECEATLAFRKEAHAQDAAFHAEIAARRGRSKAESGHTK